MPNATCDNCRFSAASGCRLGNQPVLDGLRCEAYAMSDEFREALLSSIRADLMTQVVINPGTPMVDLPPMATR